MQPDLAADIVAAQFPELRPVRATYLGEGYDSTAFDVNGHWVFRFPKRSDVEQQLFVERRILPLLTEGTPVPIPKFCFHGVPSLLFPRHLAGYAKLGGVPAIGLRPTQVRFPEVAPVLGRFLSFLHSFPLSAASESGVPEHARDLLIEEAGAEALSDLHLVRQVAPFPREAEWRSFLEAGIDPALRLPMKPALVHGDLAAEHILLDPVTHEVTGIIDWSEIAVSDPAIDFAGVLHWGGIDFLNAVLSHYPDHTDIGLLNRARYFAVCRGIGDIVFGREMDRPEYIEAGVRALGLCERA